MGGNMQTIDDFLEQMYKDAVYLLDITRIEIIKYYGEHHYRKGNIEYAKKYLDMVSGFYIMLDGYNAGAGITPIRTTLMVK